MVKKRKKKEEEMKIVKQNTIHLETLGEIDEEDLEDD